MFFPVVCWALSLFWLLLCFHTCGCFSQLKCDTWYSASNWLLFPFLRWMSWMMYELVCSCTSHVCVYVCVCAGFCPEDRSCFHRGQARPWWGAIRGVFQTTPHGRGACMELSEFQDHVVGHVISCDWSCDQSWLVMWSACDWSCDQSFVLLVYRVHHSHKSAKWQMFLKVCSRQQLQGGAT